MHFWAEKTKNDVHWTQRRWVQVALGLLCLVFLLSHLKTWRAVPSSPIESASTKMPVCSSPPCFCASSSVHPTTSSAQPLLSVPAKNILPEQNEKPLCTAEEQATFLEIQKRELAPLEQSCSLWEALPHDETYEAQRRAKLMECFQSAMIYVNDIFDEPTRSEYKICNPVDRKKGILLLQKICEEEHDNFACETLLSTYFKKENFNQVPAQAMSFLRTLCPTTPQACGVLGNALADSTKPWYNPSEAEKYLQVACDQEGGFACLATLHLREQRGNSPQGMERIRWVAKACSSETEETQQACEEISKLILDGRWSRQKDSQNTSFSIQSVESPEPAPTGWAPGGGKVQDAQPTSTVEHSGTEGSIPPEAPSSPEESTQPVSPREEDAHE